MRYMCLIYFDPQKVFDDSPESNALLASVGPHDRELSASGRLVSSEALTLPKDAMTVSVRDGKMSATDGPFLETKEVLAGFLLIEARDLNEAVQIAGGIPFAKVGHVEVRPVVDFSQPRPKL
ncbi:MAG: YciI family protein [Polyangiaceae bacterium]|nr:YciI family protein [Polyangiaceae bacterium]